MNPQSVIRNPQLVVLHGDCRRTLATLPEKSVQCVVTSPPYWALRSYLPKDHPDKALEIGREATPQEYVATMVGVFRQLWRVLRDDGTVWLNLGDSYAASGMGGNGPDSPFQKQQTNRGTLAVNNPRIAPAGFKPKDLIGIPWRVALALQEDGWYLRSDIIWAKPNCMPEGVTDRPTRSHEYIFLLTKSERYFYDYTSIKEPCIYDVNGNGTAHRKARVFENNKSFPTEERNGLRAGEFKDSKQFNGKHADKQRGHSQRHAGFNDRWDKMTLEEQCTGTRNKRDVWFISPALYKGAHFATFPPELIKPCILAGTSEKGCCPACGAPWKRIVEKGAPDEAHRQACGADALGGYEGKSTKNHAAHGVQDASAVKARILEGMRERITTGWKPTCACVSESVIPCTVLDPFGGSGTTGAVALELGRAAILCELNDAYLPLIHQRTDVTPGLSLA